ncbi:hypothetical protein [Thauera linaloolentis]|uniref:Uncharacterized protein n=1 Tax=Thauera linaloolentis (strain DSM 12138 / JCM 21573 / CCUG 41526 / CIP 105981 / IAM 15112 / NBRC 102519 / 47Lol) TaxID=1123367 RepID=N6Y6X8_THAL4|nr:hypothetical protein [Thauera linaloolentis]ENO89976.1 hypothetical protein C666_03785 [Thauera linaloolentis 47Lol = DSM 12138]MCM8566597.1 hypothetical protein [Thauera linaloolentis]
MSTVPSATPYDGLYKQLFSHPPMVEALLRGFVHENWVARVDTGRLDRRGADGGDWKG